MKTDLLAGYDPCLYALGYIPTYIGQPEEVETIVTRSGGVKSYDHQQRH